jgi:hypothetical protein
VDQPYSDDHTNHATSADFTSLSLSQLNDVCKTADTFAYIEEEEEEEEEEVISSYNCSLP